MKRIFSILLVLLLSVCAAGAHTIKGTVRSGQKKLPGVVVTDGTAFTVTDSKGAYSLPLGKDAEFVYIFTPSGYFAPSDGGVPQFFSRVAGKQKVYDFDLAETEYENGYAVLAVADPQVKTKAHVKRLVAETEPDLAATIASYREAGVQPVGLYLGDIVWDNLDLFPNIRSHMERLGIPVYSVIGNHDFDLELKGVKESGRQFRENFGPTDYGFNLGERYFIVLNDIVYDTRKQYENSLEDSQLEWLKNYTRFIPAGSEVYIAIHAPYAWGFENGEISYIRPEVLDIFKDYRLSFISGHRHINITAEIAPGVMEHNVASAGGAWWLCDLNNDGTPNGYKVFEFIGGGDARWYYKSTGRDRSYQYRAYDRGEFADFPNSIVVKVWDSDLQWNVEWYEDGRPMGAMRRVESKDPDYYRVIDAAAAESGSRVSVVGKGGFRDARANFFYYEAVPDPDAKEVEIVITDRFGKVYRHHMNLGSIDIQVYRGMGFIPENTPGAMMAAAVPHLKAQYGSIVP